jgi:hypothetical protein
LKNVLTLFLVLSFDMRLNTLLALALAAGCGVARASSIADLGLSLEQIRALNAQLTAPIAAPGIAFGSPTAFGAGWGQAFAGAGGQTLSAPGQDLDGSALLGFGLGNPHRGVAFEAAMNVISLRDSFGSDGNWSFKAHRMLTARSAVAIGVEDTGGWGDASDTSASTYAAYTHVIELDPATPKRPLTLALNLGLGTERFADPADDAGAFGSAALSWHRQSSVIVDYNGRDFGVAVSAVPFYRIPLVVTAGFINLSERHADLEFAAGAGYLYSF